MARIRLRRTFKKNPHLIFASLALLLLAFAAILTTIDMVVANVLATYAYFYLISTLIGFRFRRLGILIGVIILGWLPIRVLIDYLLNTITQSLLRSPDKFTPFLIIAFVILIVLFIVSFAVIFFKIPFLEKHRPSNKDRRKPDSVLYL